MASIRRNLKFFGCSILHSSTCLKCHTISPLVSSPANQIDDGFHASSFARNMRLTVFPATERPAFPQAALQRTSRNRCFISTRNRRTSSTARPSRASKLCIIGSPRRSSSDGSGLLAFMTISRMVSLVFGTRLETFTPVVHGDMRIKADAVLSGGRSCLVKVRDLPADHDKPLTPERPLRRNPVGHKRSARRDWGLLLGQITQATIADPAAIQRQGRSARRSGHRTVECEWPPEPSKTGHPPRSQPATRRRGSGCCPATLAPLDGLRPPSHHPSQIPSGRRSDTHSTGRNSDHRSNEP
jgi:hypothetical protein